VGKNLPTSLREAVKVKLEEMDGLDAVLLGEREAEAGAQQREQGSDSDHTGSTK
jgi:pyrimidine operon attenuation protein/uracil phosphoribosyltransferase